MESIEDDDNLTVVVFTSRNPEFFLAHHDTERDPAKTVTMPPGPTGMQPWLDSTARLIRARREHRVDPGTCSRRRQRVHPRV